MERHADEPHWPQSEPLDRDFARKVGGQRPPKSGAAPGSEAVPEGPLPVALWERDGPRPIALWRGRRAEIELAAGTTFEDMPPISLHRNPHIMTCLAVLFSKSKKYICGKQYSVNHREGFSMLENAIRRMVRIQLVHDKDKFENPSCAQQNNRIRGLAEHARDLGHEGCLEVRTLKPSKFGPGGFNSQHSNTWIVDGEIYADGSANLTGQSTKNFESLLVTRDKGVIEAAKEAFSDAWDMAETVGYDRLLSLPEHTSRSRNRSLAAV